LSDGWKVTPLDINPDYTLYPTPSPWFDITTSKYDAEGPVDAIVHLAAKAGVRRSFAEHESYIHTNVFGTQRMLDLAVRLGVKQFVFASSSSVYGTNKYAPWHEDSELRPASPYAATKVAGEAMGRVYSHAFGLRFVGLRFFTVYGPNQRKDLAIRMFAERMLAGQAVTVYGDGSMTRDYTHVSDVVDGIVAAMHYHGSTFDAFNIGCGRPVKLASMVTALADAIGVSPVIEWCAEQAGDVPQTWADIEKAKALLGYRPKVAFADGVAQFVWWLKAQQKVQVPA
jgi:UDP-glucuronate 4-epimerase